MKNNIFPSGLKEPTRAIASQLLRPKRLAIFEACLIGLVAGLAGVILKIGVGWLGTWRVATSLDIPAHLLLPTVGLIGGLITGLLVERFAPETAGSGIPNVKASLAGVPISLDARVALIKLTGTIVAVGSGLTLGRQGPTVQIGAALAAWISHWVPTSPDYRRQLIACGAAAGLAAGFNAPIAGVLFVVEELLHDVSGFTLGPAIIASFIGAVVSQLLGGQIINLNLNIYHASFLVSEIPFYVLLGILAGLLGAGFSQGIIIILKFNQRVLRLSLPIRIGIAGLISGLVIASLPVYFRNYTGLREIIISNSVSNKSIIAAFIAHFFLTIIAAGSGAPGGLFAPSLVLGSALGHIVGIWQGEIIGIGEPTTYALAGMGAFFCAVSRTPITAVVIVFEITQDFQLVLPLMIGSVVAYLVADKLDNGSLYDRILELNNINLKKEKPADDLLQQLTAADVMQRRVETLSVNLPIDEVMQAFSRSQHRGFPVVDGDKLVGIVTQTDLANMQKSQLPGNTPLKEIMTPQPLTVMSNDSLSEVLYALNRYNLSRLPVIENRRVVGIITRSDIIRAESDYVSGEKNQIGPHPESSYIVYQTRSPTTGQGRLLVPLVNPETAPALLRFAAAIARDRNYEIECLQVMLVPRHTSPSRTPVRTTNARRLLQQADRVGKDWQVPVHTQVRLAHDVAPAILETVKERHIDLILMGWNGVNSTPGRIFGNTTDTIIRQASSDVILVKWSENINFDKNYYSIFALNRWLVPIRGGPNVSRTLQLLPALIAISNRPEIRLCQIFNRSLDHPDTTELDKATDYLKSQLDCPIFSLSVCAPSVPDAVIDLAEKDQFDVIVLGASREGFLKQAIAGNIPEAIASNVNSTVILVRGALG